MSQEFSRRLAVERIGRPLDQVEHIELYSCCEHHLVPFGGNEVAHDMQELRGKILMDEQELQSGYPVWSSRQPAIRWNSSLIAA